MQVCLLCVMAENKSTFNDTEMRQRLEYLIIICLFYMSSISISSFIFYCKIQGSEFEAMTR